jgi:hypothetical protein
MTSGPGDESPERKAGAVLTLIGSVVAPVTFITALLYYFAWIRESAVFGYFGVDQAVLGFSNTDYLLRSAGVAFKPLAALIVLVALILGAYAFASKLLTDRPAKVRVVFVLTFLAVGGFLTLFGLGVVFGYEPVPQAAIRAPIALGVGVALVESGASLADGMRRSGDSGRQRPQSNRGDVSNSAKGRFLREGRSLGCSSLLQFSGQQPCTRSKVAPTSPTESRIRRLILPSLYILSETCT